MKTHYDSLMQQVISHPHDAEDITGLADLLKGFQGTLDASEGTALLPVIPPVSTVSGWWLITEGGYVLIGETGTLFEPGDMLGYTLSTDTYSRVDSKLNDAQVDITSTFTKLLTGLATQKLVNERLDKLITVSSSAPAITDDSSLGFFIGSIWVKSSTDVYQALNVTPGAAVWRTVSSYSDAQLTITSTFTKLLTGLATQKLVNEKLDKLITTSSSAPTVNDDTAAGFFVGCIWIKSSVDVYQAADVTTGAAVWKKVSSVNDAQVDVTSTFTKLLTGLATQKLVNEKLDKLITTSSSAPTVNDDTTAGYFVGCIWIKSSVDVYQAADVTTGAAVWKKVSSVNDAQVDVTSTFTKLLTGLATQKLVNEKVDKLITTSSSAPSVNDDTAAGYFVGCIWIKSSVDVYQAADVTTGAAVWKKVSSVNDAQVDVTSTFTKLLTGLATQKTINEKVDKLITVTTTAPVVTSDGANGFFVGCLWVDTTAGNAYQCKDSTTGAAVWLKISSVNDAQVDVTSTFTKLLTGLATQKLVNEKLDKLITTSSSAPTINDDTTAGYFVGCIWIKSSVDVYQAADVTTGAAVWKKVSSVNDAQVDVTSTFTKLLTGLATQKTINEKVDKLITVTTTAPGVTSDAANGFFNGCLWVNTATSSAYQCKDATTGAAVWINISLNGSETLAYRDFTSQSADPASPAAGTQRMFAGSIGQIFIKDSAGIKSMLSPGVMINHIGTPGGLGFGVGICPPETLAVYNSANVGGEIFSLPGCYDINSDNYGNYMCAKDASIMVWIPFCWVKRNPWDVKPAGYFATEAAANAASYMLPRVFVNGSGGVATIKKGIFVDKYGASLTGITAADLDASGSLSGKGVLSSIKNGNPISSENVSLRKLVTGSDNLYAGSFANCRSNTQTPVDAYYGGFAAIKSRGNNFHIMSVFARALLFDLVKAHQTAAVGVNFCAWNDVSPYFPKGNNNYGVDYNDTAVTFSACTDAYWSDKTAPMEARKCGSGSVFNKTTHNGQASGVCDINGNQWIFLQGLTSAGSTMYILKDTVDIKTVTGGDSGATDHWGSTGIAAMFEAITPDLSGADDSNLGNGANEVFDGSTDRTAAAYKIGSALLCKAATSYSAGGSTAYGNDCYYNTLATVLAPIGFGSWYTLGRAGVGALILYNYRTYAGRDVSVRGCLLID